MIISNVDSLFRFPFYYWIKIGIVLWIVSPVGSTILYKRFVQPVLKERERVCLNIVNIQISIEEFDLGNRSINRKY